MMKTCRMCGEEKLETDFYKYNRKCKKCCNKMTYDGYKRRNADKPRVNMKLYDLDDEIKANIRKDINMGLKLNVVSKKYNIKYTTLCHWNQIGAF